MPKLDHSLQRIPLSYPIKVEMAGFMSDTVRLQQNGWQISARQQMSARHGGVEISLALKHEGMRQYAVTNTINLDYRIGHFAHNGAIDEILQYYQEQIFRVVHIAPQIEFMVAPPMHFMEIDTRPGAINYFTPIDARPQWVDMPKRFNLADMAMFRKVDNVDEVLIERASVDDLMKLILEKQAPKQAQIRANQRRSEFKKEFESFDNPREIKAQLVIAG